MTENKIDYLSLLTPGKVKVQTNAFEKYVCKPLIVAGLLTGCGSLAYGLYSFKKGNSAMSQKMMRTRVASQGFTVIITTIAILSVVWRQAVVPSEDYIQK